MLKSFIKTVNRLLGKRISKRAGRQPNTVSEEIETDRAGGGINIFEDSGTVSRGLTTSTNRTKKCPCCRLLSLSYSSIAGLPFLT